MRSVSVWSARISAILFFAFALTQLHAHKVAAVAACSVGGAAQNGISVDPSHGQAFYIDSGTSPKLDSGYIGYRVTNNTGSTQGDLWTQVSSFTGGNLSLANSLDGNQQLSTLTNTSTGASYFLLKATSATNTPQTHRVKIWNGRPDLPTSTVLYDCLYTFTAVKETIKAAANKVQDTGLGTSAAIEVSNTNPQLGQTVTITIEGATGTIGAGSSPDGSIVWLTPAAISSWPTRALQLTNVSVIFERDTSGGHAWGASGDQVTYTNQLIITNAQNCLKKGANTTTCTGGSGTASAQYRATYTFRVIGVPTSTVSAVPVAQIASGTQIKHADTTAAGSTLNINFTGVNINASLTKSVTQTTGLTTVTCGASCTVPGGTNGATYVAVPYRLTGSSTNATTVTLDEFVDQPQTGVIYKPGSAKITDIGRSSVTIDDPSYLASESGLSPQPLHFVGPFTLNSGTNASLDYTMWVPVGSYTNTAYGKIGDLVIGANASAMSKVVVTSNGTSTVGVVTTTQSFGVDAETDPATSMTTTAATLNGVVDPNGANPLTAQFQYSTNSNLSGATTVTATTPASGNVSSLTDPTNVSYNLSGLTSNTTYYYRVIAGAAQGSILSFQTLPVQTSPAVTTTAATTITSAGATLNGTINPNLTSIVAIQFIYSTSATLASGNTTVTLDDGGSPAANLTASGASTQSFSTAVTGLSNGTTYYFKIRECTTTNCNAGNFIDGSILNFVASNPPSNPVLSVTKVDDDADNIVVPGQQVNYTVTITNSGGVTGTTSFTDTIPTGMGTPTGFTSVNCGTPTNSYSAPTLTVSSLTVTNANSCIVSYAITVNSPYNSSATLTNSVDVATAAEGGNNPAPVSADTLTVDTTPDLSTSTKSVNDNNGGNVEPGDTLTYTLTLKNTGDGQGTGISATDTISSNTQNLTNVTRTNCGSSTNSSTSTALNVTGITVAVGTNCVITFDVSVKTPLNEGATIANTATISAATEGGPGAAPSSTTKTVDATPNLVVANSEDDADNIVTRNQVVTYTFTIQNNGNGQATGVSATDALDSNLTANTGTLNYISCGSPSSTSTSSNIAINSITVAAGATCSISYQATVSGSATNNASIPNSVDVSAASEGGNDPTAAAASTLTVFVPAAPNLSTSTKSVSDLNAGTVEPGDTLRYTITMINTGGQTGTGVAVTDTINSNTQNLTNVQRTNCGSSTNSSTGIALNVTGISVAVGTNCAITFDVTVKSPLNEGTSITNTATISPANEGGSGATPSSTTQTVDATPALVVSNSENDADNIVTRNQTVGYTVTIQNNGNGQATGISASSAIDSDAALDTSSFGFTNCGSPSHNSSTTNQVTLGSITIAAGTTCTITYSVNVSGTASDGATIPNSIDVSAATEGGNDPTAAAATTLTVSVPTLPDFSGSTKTVADLNAGTVEPGDALRYTISAYNSGGTDATGVNITDTIDSNTQNLTNVITGASSTNCGSPTNNSTGTKLDVSSISVTHGTICKITFDVTVKSPTNEGTTIANTATISPANEGGPGATPSSTTLHVDATPALVVTNMENDADSIVTRNQTVGYTVTIQNNGNGQATGISASSTIDADAALDTASFGFTNCGSPSHNTSTSSQVTLGGITINAGATCTITYNVTVDGSAVDGATIPNSIDVSAATEGGNDPAAANATTLTVSVLTSPDLSGSTKTVADLNAGTVEPGDTLRYTISIINGGGTDATGISVSDTINSNTQNLTNVVTGASSTSCGSPTNSSTGTKLDISNISATASTTCKITFDVTVKSPLNEGTSITNSATISPPNEGGPGASPSSTTLIVDATPALSVTYTDDDADNIVTRNQTVEYTATIHNTGNGQATGITASSAISSNATLMTGSFNFTNCGSPNSTSAASNLALDSITVNAGATCTITFNTQVKNSAAGGATIPSTIDVGQATEGGNDPAGVDADTLTVFIAGTPANLNFRQGTTDLGCSATTNNRVVKLTWSAVSGATTYEVSVDSNPYTSTGTNTFYDWTIPAIDGAHSFTVIEVDGGGNVSAASASCDITLDQAAPTVDAGSNKKTKTTFAQTTSSASDSGSGIATYAWSKVSGPGTVNFSSSSILHPDISATADGTYVIKLTVTDNAGNSANDTFQLIWDTTPPDITLIGNDPIQLTVGGTFTDPGATANDNIDGDVTASVTSGNNVDTSTPGTYTVTYHATDQVGNIGTKTRTVIVSAATPPPTADNDGASSTVEQAAPNAGDANDDGMPDADQKNVTSFVNPVTNTYATLDNASNCQNTDVSQERESATGHTDGSYEYPAGLMNFKLVCAQSGVTVQVSQYFFGVDSAHIVARKYNDLTRAYSTITGAIITDVSIGGKQAVKISYDITDGGPLDEDGQVNGSITDPSGPAILKFVSTTHTPGTSSSVLGAPDTGHGNPENNTLSSIVITMILILLGLIATTTSFRARK